MITRRFSFALFDFDGVIVDSEPLRLKTYKTLFLKTYGVDIEIDQFNLVGKPESHNLEQLLKQNGLDFNKENLRSLKFKRSQILLDEARKKFPIIQNIAYIINSLGSLQIPMGIVTNSSLSYIHTVMDTLKINSNDFHIVTGDDVSKPKPDPQSYFKALKGMNVCAEHGLAFEDSKAGLTAVQSTGLSSVAVLSTYSKNELSADFYLKPALNLISAKKLISLFGAQYA